MVLPNQAHGSLKKASPDEQHSCQIATLCPSMKSSLSSQVEISDSLSLRFKSLKVPSLVLLSHSKRKNEKIPSAKVRKATAG